ncbi:MAG: serine hydrolase domain-containing protein [Deltaproteobacteria bacterium]
MLAGESRLDVRACRASGPPVDQALRRILEDAVADRGVAGASLVGGPNETAESCWVPSAEVEPAFLAFSITKTFTATCVLQLCEHGQLALDDCLSRWFPVEDLQTLAPALSTSLAEHRCLRDTRLHYHPGWVSHGVVASTPSEIARFFAALFSGRILSSTSLAAMTELVTVPPHLAPGSSGQPGYGLGIMGDPATVLGPSWGHTGGGPGYQASAQHLAGIGATVCVMAGIEQGFSAQDVAWRMLETFAAQTGSL